MRVTFIVPAFNEARTIDEVLDRIAELQLDWRDGFKAIWVLVRVRLS